MNIAYLIIGLLVGYILGLYTYAIALSKGKMPHGLDEIVQFRPEFLKKLEKKKK